MIGKILLVASFIILFLIWSECASFITQIKIPNNLIGSFGLLLAGVVLLIAGILHRNSDNFSLTENSSQIPSYRDRIAAFALAYIPFRIVYQSFIFAGPPSDAVCTNLPFENSWPVMEYSTIIYALLYPIALVLPVIINTRKNLKAFVFDIWFVTIISGLIFFVLPFYVHQRTFIPKSFIGHFLLYDRAHDGESGALPSFHVIWAFIAAHYFTLSFKKFKWIWYTVAILISISCVTTANHSILDVIAGAGIFLIIIYRLKILNFIRMKVSNKADWSLKAELTANAISTGIIIISGLLILGCLNESGISGDFMISLFCTLCILLFTVNYRFSLLPYSYSIAFVIIVSVTASLIFHLNIYVLLTSVAMSAPWIRILMSPRKLFPIISNLFIGLILFRLFRIHMNAAFIMGTFLILTGSVNFTEDAGNMENSPVRFSKMTLPQWVSFALVIGGIISTTLTCELTITYNFNPRYIIYAFFIGAIVLPLNLLIWKQEVRGKD